MKSFTKEHKRKIGEANKISLKGKHVSPKTEFKKGHKLNTWKNNPRYIDGRSKFPYPEEWTNKLKDQIRKRDSYCCRICNKSKEQEFIEIGQELSIHHIDYNKQNCNEGNLITLCKKCNTKVNSNRDYWFAYFTYIMGE